MRSNVRLTDSTMRGKSDQLFKDASSAWDSGDLGRAFELFSQAAEAGDASCQLNLGYFYDCGLHVPRDERLARRWYLQAYRQGEASAASNIATLYRDAHDYGRMIWWWRASSLFRRVARHCFCFFRLHFRSAVRRLHPFSGDWMFYARMRSTGVVGERDEMHTR